MSGCELRARGAGLSTHYILSEAAFSGAVVHEDGFDLNLSQSDDLQTQIESVRDFLSTHQRQCRALADLLLPDVPLLDFALWRKEAASHSFVFPAPLIREAAALGFELKLSLYRLSDL
ncbi:MAG: hypothetical protein PVI91_09165 [Gammaproteobacteria bacterium]|jgi:hypothetical protein